MANLRLILPAVCLWLLSAAGAAQAQFPFHNHDTVVMLGDSITAQRLHTIYIEGYLRTRYPQWGFRFHNAGLPGDTTGNALRRLDRDVLSWHPDVVTIELGVNDATAGFSGIQTYLNNMASLITHIESAGALPVLLAAGPLNDGTTSSRLAGTNAVLAQMATRVLGLAQDRSLPVADQLHLLLDVWGNNYHSPTGVALGGSAVHPGPPGHLTKAWACLSGLGAPSLVSEATIDCAKSQLVGATECSISDLVCTPTWTGFVRTDNCLPMPIADEAWPGLKLVPLAADLSHYGLTVRGLHSGMYDLSIDGITVVTKTAHELAEGIELGTMAVGPIHDQCQQVLSLIAAGQDVATAVRPVPHRFSVALHGVPHPPAVVKWYPRGSAVSPTTPVTVRFDLPMQRPSVERSFVVTPATPGTFTWIGTRVTFTPSSPWHYAGRYQIRINAAARSTAGVKMGVPFTWSFGTVAPAPSPPLALSLTGQPTAAGEELVLNLTAAADVTVTIRNLAGRDLAVLTPGTLKTGLHTLLWDRKSQWGTTVPAGAYVVSVAAQRPDGTRASAIDVIKL